MPMRIEAGKRTQQQLEYEQRELERMRNASSRLVAVDVGNDPDALRARYADTRRYLRLPTVTQHSALCTQCHE